MNNKIKKWEKLTQEITKQFLLDYFEDDNPDYYYVANEVGGVFNYGDYWFSFYDVLKCYKLNITKEQLFEWYDFCLENQTVNISLAKYILSPQEREEHLAELKERVRVAEEEFEKAIEKTSN